MTPAQLKNISDRDDSNDVIEEYRIIRRDRQAEVYKKYIIIHNRRWVNVFLLVFVALTKQHIMAPPLFSRATWTWSLELWLGTQAIWAAAALGTWCVYRYDTTLGIGNICNNCGYRPGEIADTATSSPMSACPECGAGIRTRSIGVERIQVYSRSDASIISIRFVFVWIISTGVWVLRWVL